MKKKLLIFVMALMSLCGYAQQGEQAVGVNLGVAPYVGSGPYSFTNFQLGLLYRYNITDNIRLEGDLDYGFKDNGLGIFDITANAQYLFQPWSKITVYPFLGVGYANVSGYGSSLSRFVLNAGVGGEYALKSNLDLGLKINYQYIKNFVRLPMAIYVTYKF